MGDAARVTPACVWGYEAGTVPTGRPITDVSVPHSQGYRTMTNSAQLLRDGVRKPPPVAGGYTSSCLSRQVQSEAAGVPAHLQSPSFPLLLPLGVTGYSTVSQYRSLSRHTVPPTPATYSRPYSFPGTTFAAYTKVRMDASLGCPSSTSGEGKLCVINNSKHRSDGLAVRGRCAGASGCQATWNPTSTEPSRGRCVQLVPCFVQHDSQFPIHFWHGSSFPLPFTDPSIARGAASTATSRPSKESAACQVHEMSPPHPCGLEKQDGDKLPRLLQSEYDLRTVHGHRQAKPLEMREPCIGDIRAPPLQRGNVLFCSYCKRRLVKQKNYMPCWPEFLLCDTCALLPRCNVCHRKALPAHISLGHEFDDYEGPRQTNTSRSNTAESSTIHRRTDSINRYHSGSSTTGTTIKHDNARISGERSIVVRENAATSKGDRSEEDTRRMNNAESVHSEKSAADTEQSAARDRARIRCEPLHDAEGLHLCGHCAMLNPVTTKEGLLRLTQYALLWLQERHGLVFSKERLAAQRHPLVQQRMRESLLRQDRWRRSASTPEVMLQQTLQRNNKANGVLVSGKSEEGQQLSLEIECSSRVPAHPLRIEPTESVRPAWRQARRGPSPRKSGAGETASLKSETTAVKKKVKDDVYLMPVLAQNIEVCHSGEATRQCQTKLNVHSSTQEQCGCIYHRLRHQATLNEEKDGSRAHEDELPTEQQNNEYEEEERPQLLRLSDGTLGFTVEAVGYTQLNLGKNSNVFGRCETERVPYDHLLLHFHTQADRNEQRRELHKAVQVSRGDALAAAGALTAASESSTAMQFGCSRTPNTSRQSTLLPASKDQECSLNCVRRVSVLRCLPETVFLSHLVHELVHAYIWCGQPTKGRTMLLQIEEGICNAVAASFLHERLQRLTIWEAQMADARSARRCLDLHAPLHDSAVSDNAEETTTRKAYTVLTTHGVLPQFQTVIVNPSAPTGSEALPACLPPVVRDATRMNARASAVAHKREIQELDAVIDVGSEEREELLLLLVRHEARILRTRLNEMETDEHFCYGKGYRVMRRIIEDIQLQQTLSVAARYGSSLEAVEQAAANLRSRKFYKDERDLIDRPPGRRTASSSNTLDVKGEPCHLPRTLPLAALRYNISGQEDEHLQCRADAAAQSKSTGRVSASGSMEQQLQSQRQTRHPTTLYEAPVDAPARKLRQSQHASPRQSQQVHGLPTRESGSCSIPLPDAKMQINRAQPTSTRGALPKRLAATSAARTAAGELLEIVCALFWQKTPSAGKHDAFEESATICGLAAHMEREREHAATATASG